MDKTHETKILVGTTIKKLKEDVKEYKEYRVSIPMEFVKDFNLKKGQGLVVQKDQLGKKIIYQINPFDAPTQIEWMKRQVEKDNRKNKKSEKKKIISPIRIKKSQKISWYMDNLKAVNEKIKGFKEDKIYLEKKIKQLTSS